MRPQTVFQGNSQEASSLTEAVAHNCSCTFSTPDGALQKRCAPHNMMLYDQRALDGLVVYQHMAAQLRREEGIVEQDP